MLNFIPLAYNIGMAFHSRPVCLYWNILYWNFFYELKLTINKAKPAGKIITSFIYTKKNKSSIITRKDNFPLLSLSIMLNSCWISSSVTPPAPPFVWISTLQ